MSPSRPPTNTPNTHDSDKGAPSPQTRINEGPFHAAHPRDRSRWRWRTALWPRLLTLLLALYLIPAGSGTDTDWSLNCPAKCTCKWIHGRRTAECRDAGFRSIPALSHEVQVLDLSGNSISTLAEDVFRKAGLTNLQKIFLRNCQIELIDRQAFRDLRILIELDLSGNRIRTLVMEGFETNERLRELQLNDNPLNKLTGIQFPPLQHLSKLGLNNCQLSEFSGRTFEKLVNLEQLDLSGNRFGVLSEDLLRPLRKLKSLGLRDNPWRCDCRLKSFREWASANKLLQVGTKCAEPGPVANFEWNVLLASNFACAPEIVNMQVNGQVTDVGNLGDVGMEISLSCLVRANPPADVRWVRDNMAVTNSSQGRPYVLHISGETERWVNLTIQNTQPGDAGEYTCVGENKGGSVEKNATVAFHESPPGAGVGPGKQPAGGSDSQSWLWIVIGIISTCLLLVLVILVVFVCTRRRRASKTSRSQDLKGLQQQSQPLVEHESLGGRSTPKEGTTPLLPGGPPEGSNDPDYPDLLDLPHRAQESPAGSSASTVILPQQLNPAALYDPSRGALAFGHPPHLYHTLGRAQSPYSGSVASFASEPPPQVIVPSRPGYVTLPRRPRVPSWSPAQHTPLSTSPTGSSVMGPYVKYDNLGPRTTADGSSRLSLDKVGLNGTPGAHSATLPHRARSPALRSAPLPSLHSPGPHFNFDPIEEVEGPTTPVDNFPSNYGLPLPTAEDPLQTLPRSWAPSSNVSPEPRSAPGGLTDGKKVPPKPPPKPAKKAEAGKADDGTEV